MQNRSIPKLVFLEKKLLKIRFDGENLFFHRKKAFLRIHFLIILRIATVLFKDFFPQICF